MSDRLKRLAELAATLRDRELEVLRARNAARAALQDEATRLREMPLAAEDPAAELTGAGERWLDWRRDRLRDLATRTALAAAEAETQKARAQFAFGRAAVLGRLANEGKRRR